MNYKSYGKRGRALFAAVLTTMLVMLSSCGKDNYSISSNGNMNDKSEVSSAASIEYNDSMSDPIERLSGTFYIDGDRSAASVVIESDGSFTAYYASGTAEQEGYVRYEAEESGFHVYVFYTEEGKPYMGFVDSGENIISEFETGNGSYKFVRVE